MKAITVLTLVVLAAGSQADLKSSTKSIYDNVSKAFLKKDMKAFEKATRAFMTKDFKSTQNGKTMTYDEMIADMKGTFAQFKSVASAKAAMASFKEMGAKANSVTTHSIAGTIVGADKKTHKVTMSGTSNDTWVKEGKTWKMSSMKWVKQTMTMDGKPFNPGVPAAPVRPTKDH